VVCASRNRKRESLASLLVDDDDFVETSGVSSDDGRGDDVASS